MHEKRYRALFFENYSSLKLQLLFFFFLLHFRTAERVTNTTLTHYIITYYYTYIIITYPVDMEQH